MKNLKSYIKSTILLTLILISFTSSAYPDTYQQPKPYLTINVADHRLIPAYLQAQEYLLTMTDIYLINDPSNNKISLFTFTPKDPKNAAEATQNKNNYCKIIIHPKYLNNEMFVRNLIIHEIMHCLDMDRPHSTNTKSLFFPIVSETDILTNDDILFLKEKI